MANKEVIKNCKCAHCQQKLEQIKLSKVYWDKLLIKK